MADLKPCPFCGGEMCIPLASAPIGLWYAECMGCGAVAPDGPSREEAIRLANRRALVAALDAGALRAGDIVRSSTYGICAVVDPTPKILCGDPAVHLPLSDLKRVEDR